MRPAERLRWLKETGATLRRWQGRARWVAGGGAGRPSHRRRRRG